MGFWSWFAKLFPRITAYRVTQSVLETMRELAWQTHPKEVMGLLRGRHEQHELIVDTIVYQPFENTSYSATIRMDPTLTGIVGTFHSHPGGSPQPSRQDLRLFAKNAGVHAILPEPYDLLYVYDQRGALLGTHPIRVDRAGSRAVPRARRENR